MSKWELLRWIHVLALSFFVGGQLMLIGVVVPVMRTRDRAALRMAARRFAVGSGLAGVVLLVTGSLLASHLHLWGSTALQVKLALVGAVVGLIVVHARKPDLHALEGLVFLLSLAIVALGVSLGH